ncbi:MAG: glycosyltransferase family protein [Bacteroidales bacterium]|nr:glycosyltransferase family protein [Bacteroidales bacterium]
MRYLFIIQGEGRGHLTQALALKSFLEKNGHTVIGVMIGKTAERQIPAFFTEKIEVPVKIFENPNFAPSAGNKRPKIGKTLLKALRKIPEYIKSIRFIRQEIGRTQPDFVINFYDHLTGLTWFIYHLKTPLICIGHQYLLNHKAFEFPKAKNKRVALSMKISSWITSLRARKILALSFYPLEEDPAQRICVVPPLLRPEIFTQPVKNDHFITGYILNSGFAEEIKAWHQAFPNEEAHFFWDKKDAPDTLEIEKNLTFHKIQDTLFLDLLSRCKAFACTAGFESVCEAMYFGKPTLMVPVHIEQECNAHDGIRAGAGISSDHFDLESLLKSIDSYHPKDEYRAWVLSAETLYIKNLTK